MNVLRSGVLFLLLLIIALTSSGTAWAQAAVASADPVGNVDKLLGTANFLRPNQAPAAIALNAETFHTDVLETDAESLLEVLLNDGSRIKLDENTSLTIAEYDTTGIPVGVLELARGRLRSTVGTTFSSRRDSFQVKTAEGALGVQGTTYDVIAYGGESELFVYTGVVSATHVDPAFPDVKLVRAGETVRWKIDEPIPEPTKFCDTCAPDDEPILVPPADSTAPITVGPRDKVGKESLGSKAGKKVVGGLIGGLLGGRSSKSSSKKPKTKRDPSRKIDFVSLKDASGDGELEMRSKWTEDGLLVSTRIEDFPDKGTFQTVFLEDCSGARLGPSKIEIYKIWSEAKLTVSWTKTTFVNGQQTSQESGGWTESWILDSDILSRRTPDGLPEMPAIWKQLGYARSHAGVRHIGTYFNLTPEQLAEKGRVAAFAHITRPETDPVVTAPFSAMLTPGSSEVVNVASTTGGANAAELADWNKQCVDARPLVPVLPLVEAAPEEQPAEQPDEPDEEQPTCEDMLNAPWPAEVIELERQEKEAAAARGISFGTWGRGPVIAVDDDDEEQVEETATDASTATGENSDNAESDDTDVIVGDDDEEEDQSQ